LSKNDTIYLFEQIICSSVARKGKVRAYTLGAGLEAAPTHFAVNKIVFYAEI